MLDMSTTHVYLLEMLLSKTFSQQNSGLCNIRKCFAQSRAFASNLHYDFTQKKFTGKVEHEHVSTNMKISTYVETLCPLTDTGSEVAVVARDDLEVTREVTQAGSWSARWLVQRTADQCY